MSQKQRQDPTETERGTVEISRELDFPREAVFRMLTDPKKAVACWGPEGATKYLFELEPRPGGTIRIHDGDRNGIVARTSGTILEFVTPRIFSFRSSTSLADGSAPWEALQTVTFEELGPRRTRVTVRVKVLAPGGFPGGVEPLGEGFKGGWGETFVMLERELRAGAPGR